MTFTASITELEYGGFKSIIKFERNNFEIPTGTIYLSKCISAFLGTILITDELSDSPSAPYETYPPRSLANFSTLGSSLIVCISNEKF